MLLRHPQIIQLKDLCEQPSYEDFNHLYFVFELAQGDFQGKLRNAEPITEEERRHLIYDLLKALKYTHSAHVLHRDIKPGNILMGANNVVKVGVTCPPLRKF